MDETAVASQAKHPEGSISREKYWEEKTDTEKIEALRGVVAQLSRDNLEMAKLVGALMAHSHGPDGALLGPIQQPYSNRIEGYSRDVAWSIRTKRERRD